MITYLDFLPYELNEMIDSFVLQLYQNEQREKQRILNKELNSLWLYALWGSGFNNNAIIKDLYQNNKFNNNDKPRYYRLSNIVKNSHAIKFVSPSLYLGIKTKP